MSRLPLGWSEARLRDVASSQLGRMLSKGRETGVHARPYLRNRDVQWGHINVEELPTMDFDSDDALRFGLVPGDVLVCEGGEVGRAAVWAGQLNECYFQKALHRVRTSDALNPHFLRYLLEHYARARTFAQYTSGSTINHLPQEDLRNLTVPVPPKSEQARIVAAIEEQFSRLDAGVVAMVRTRQNLARMRAAVLLAAVNGKLAEVNSDQWEFVPLEQLLLDIHAGKSFRCEERPAGPGEWGIIKVSAMTWGEFRPNENKTVLAGREIDARMEIRPGDLLVSRANTVDYVGAVVHVQDCPPRLLLSDKSLRLTPRPQVLPEWLVIALRSPMSREYIERVATGTSDSMRNISQPKLLSLIVPLPPVSTQRRLTDEVGRQMSIIAKLDGEITEYEKSAEGLRSSLLAAAFSGKLVPHDPNDESASALLEHIIAERASSNDHKLVKVRRQRRAKVTT